jgi:hypothetical protein
VRHTEGVRERLQRRPGKKIAHTSETRNAIGTPVQRSQSQRACGALRSDKQWETGHDGGEPDYCEQE